ncbi:MAG: hypothetical protein QOD06_747 [Candidatus Binatota bacterium]|jgi:regulator of sirC expression with transglutaminase-like and TPR domain|nr:hypothetical protein [Candidatus Binatota bacterium]
MATRAQDRLAAIATLPDKRIDLAEAALWIAHLEYPDLDVDAYLRRLDDLAAEAWERIAPVPSVPEKIAHLNHFLFVEYGFQGNRDDFYDPRNSFLNEVIDRRKGIPISLGVVYAEVGRRLGLPIVGVGFPGHFLVKHASHPEILVDPFHGTVVTAADCARRLEESYGPGTRLDPQMLRPAQPREILARMLRNLKQIYVGRDDLARALVCVNAILLFSPDDGAEFRDRGILYRKLECFAPALRDLERYLTLAPDDDAADEIRASLSDLRRQVERLQ